MTAWLAFPAFLVVGSLAFVAAVGIRESIRPRPTVHDVEPDRHTEAIARGEAWMARRADERDYSWSHSPIHDELLAERFRDELEQWGAA